MNGPITADQDVSTRQSIFANFLQDFQVWHIVRHIVLISLLIGYAFIGGAIFYYIESPEQQRLISLRNNATVLRQAKLVEDIDTIYESCKDRGNCLSRIEDLVRNYEDALELNTTNTKYMWTFANSLFYAGTIFTTIGYGHMYCQTNWGKTATMIYALFGIPLVMTVLNYLGKSLFHLARKNWNRLLRLLNFIFDNMKRIGHRRRSVSSARKISTNSTANDDMDANFPLSLALLIVVGYFFLCAYIFSFWETQWDFFTVFYYFFITLSTIGLGDLVPEHPTYTLFGFIFVIIGLSLVTMCINIMQAQVEDRYARAIKDLERRWEQGNQIAKLSLAVDANGMLTCQKTVQGISNNLTNSINQTRSFGANLGVLKLLKRRNETLGLYPKDHNHDIGEIRDSNLNVQLATLLSQSFAIDPDSVNDLEIIIQRSRNHSLSGVPAQSPNHNDSTTDSPTIIQNPIVSQLDNLDSYLASFSPQNLLYSPNVQQRDGIVRTKSLPYPFLGNSELRSPLLEIPELRHDSSPSTKSNICFDRNANFESNYPIFPLAETEDL